MNYFLLAFQKYFPFSGRASRQEYWHFVLFSIVVWLVMLWFDKVFHTQNILGNYGIFTLLWQVGFFLPEISVTVRRLHDTNRSGWWVLGYNSITGNFLNIIEAKLKPFELPSFFWGLIMFGFFLTMFIFLVLKSTPGKNQYGPLPAKKSK